MLNFPISGIETYWWLPVVVAFAISIITSMGGLSGAFMLLPFQVSVLGFTGPSVTPTNLVYNVLSTPSGVYRFHRERRMVWSLSWAIILGTLPGVFLGAVVRISLLPDARSFKLFVGCVLLILAIRMGSDMYFRLTTRERKAVKNFHVVPRVFTSQIIEYEFDNQIYRIKTWKLITLAFCVGIIGGAYGIGGAAIIVPFLVSVFRLPVHTVAGAALLGNFMTSIAGVLFYMILDRLVNTGEPIQADWLLGFFFGIGGALGTYVGARLQKHVPAIAITGFLVFALLAIAITYIIGFFL